ncbi:antitoxin ParD1/3/4 [Glaciimonas immobilis]|uniref:Antitoxin ParD1/3/4 n=2 Tax=Glaciimonas immobilis TaxID=728004 RepID=A0A840S0A2_9BURK|nr:antitoxin ParD1/3/4 [Glaciimonas immobilis]
MNISLPEALKAFVDTEVSQGGYGTSSEYIRELIRKDQNGKSLRRLLLDGARSEPLGQFDAAYFDGLRRMIKSQAP